ncbi:MAG: hypothetical protein KJ964_05435 [Verrucomicrobia bacterium]|nr:hypothetical protein [Verrucomicrobiota bacterium]MBU1734587.1 hypothetical protein [Verrucomicrobiota bacterium]MBU1856240.1 hypothetical protein [Verrucomicrobiota bacterium]
MSNDAESDVVHLKAGEHLPAVPVPSPTTEMLKQLLEQMLENERRRLRNEYVRISMLLLVLLAVAIGGGLWFAHSLLDQLRTERQSLYALLRPDVQTRDQGTEDSDQRSATPRDAGQGRNLSRQRRDQQPGSAGALRPGESEISNTSRADTNTVQAQADIKQLIADLDAKKQTLADMLKSQNAQTKNMLQSRDSELQILHELMQEVQRKIMNAAPPEARPVKEAKAPPAIEEVTADSLTITTSNAVTLRLPIPSP